MTVRFGQFALNLDARQLLCDGREVRLAPKAFDLLAALVLDRPRILSKTLLQERLWPSTFVSEANLSHLMSEVRAALGDDPKAPTFIRTVHGIGYAFKGDAVALSRRVRSVGNRHACWLIWGRRRFRLWLGDHIIGRDASADISLGRRALAPSRPYPGDREQRPPRRCRQQERPFRGTPSGGSGSARRRRHHRLGAVYLTFHMTDRGLSTDTHPGDTA